MKYPNMKWGKMEAIVNKLGGEEAADRFLRDELIVSEAPKLEKFELLLIELGTITVPDDYIHGKCLGIFAREEREKLDYINWDITDKNFPGPSRILKPGDKLRVKAYKQISKGTTTSEERIDFLKKQNAVLVGAQGTTLVFKQKRDLLPKDKLYLSMDEKDRLWEGPDGNHRVPYLLVYNDGDFRLDLGCFESVWDDTHIFLCFYDLN